MAKNIIDLPLNDRPYEKLELIGEENLTNSELLAIIIKNGTNKLNCLEIAQNILNTNEKSTKISDLEYLMSVSMEELKMNEGIGRVKAIQIKAVVELSKRICNINIANKDKITSPSDIARILIPKYLGKKQECLKTVILNKQNKILAINTNAIGNSDNINIGIKEVLSEPIKQMASGIILVHNHPSGSLKPSKQDISFTKHIQEYAKIFNIEILDHIIIAGNDYISLKEQKFI